MPRADGGVANPVHAPIAPGRVAVVTGAASGIGLGLAERFAAEGMRVVMADVEEPALAKAAAGLAEAGAAVLPVVTDVADRAAVDALRDAALSAFGAVHVVCNNAGVGGSHGPLWECPPGEWDWVLGVNLDGRHERRPGVHARAARAGRRAPAQHLVDLRRVRRDARAVRGVQARGHRADRDAALQPAAPSASRTSASRCSARARYGPTSARRRGTGRLGRARHDQRTRPSGRPRSGSTSCPCSAPPPPTSPAMVVDGIRSRRFYILTSDNRHEPMLRRGQEIVAGGPPEPPVSFGVR